MEIWEASLLKYCSTQKPAPKTTKKILGLKQLKSMVANSDQPLEHAKVEKADDLIRLADCFNYIYRQLYKTSNQQILQRLLCFVEQLINQEIQIKFELLNLWAIVLVKLKNFTEESISVNLARKKLKSFANMSKDKELMDRISNQVFKQITKLWKIKSIVSQDERTHKLQQIGATCILINIFDLDIESYNKEEFSIITQNILNLIEFESPRFLIQEMSNDALKI